MSAENVNPNKEKKSLFLTFIVQTLGVVACIIMYCNAFRHVLHIMFGTDRKEECFVRM